VSESIRDWGRQRGDTHYIIGSAVGPCAVPGARARPAAFHRRRVRAQALEACGRAAAARRRLRGRRLDAIGMFSVHADDEVELIGVEAAGEGCSPPHGAPLTAGGRGGVLHGSYSAIMQDEEGQITEAHSISAGLDYPGVGPEHAHLRDSGRAHYVAVTDEDAVAAFRRTARLEGIIPALESSHALAWVMDNPDSAPDALDLICLSGRGDKDLAEVLAQP
jgi:tryptophan synthase beta chain